jgi:Spy/CpxP family protein refolding chaperone
MFALRGRLGAWALTDQWADLLRSEKVRHELDITAEQLEQLKGISKKAMEEARRAFDEMQRLRDACPEERKAKFAEWAKKGRAQAEQTKEDIERVLSPRQLARLRQLAVQLRGTSALEDKQVQDELELTEEQKQQLKALRVGAVERPFGAGLPASEEERQARREMIETARKLREQKALDILTAKQREKFEEMKGPKFDLSPLRPFGRRTP